MADDSAKNGGSGPKNADAEPGLPGLEEGARTLLERGLGDKRILEQIYRASVNGEIISNHERNYVRSLLEKHADPASEKPQSGPAAQPAKRRAEAPKAKKSSTMMIAAGGGAAAIAIIAVAATMLAAPPTEGPAGTPAGFVESDQVSYGPGDFMLVTGLADYDTGQTVSIEIVDAEANQIWSEVVPVRSDGTYSTIVLVGQDGWAAGEHTIQAVHGDATYTSGFAFEG